ncbi:MAG: class I SAM-dependent methyltransferase [Bacteroidales bacterium]|nr:class I SAM-dependent methyltransferase [Bacteroidales bacterium]
MERKIDITIRSYDNYAQEYSDNIAKLAPIEKLVEFCNLLVHNAEILDLGCGSGRDSKIFIEKGYNVTGIDLADNLLKIAKAQVPKAVFSKMDIRKLKLGFNDDQFNGIWASASLLHIPKNDIPETLKGLRCILKKDGIMYISLKEGIGEKYEPDLRYGTDAFKFWAYFTFNEAKLLIEKAGFKIIKAEINYSDSTYTTNPWIEFFCKK